MQHLKIFINLTRLNKPIGFLLLFWPCSWGLCLSLSNLQSNNKSIFFYYLILFFLGSILMRSAGCIFNDIVDKDYDKRVKRTKNRPIASGKISITRSLVYVFILCFLAFFILLQFNNLTIFLGLSSMVLAFSYPFMKRITYWPQLFLGITFNWGILMAWCAMGNDITSKICLVYLSAIFWTLGYDTIYGAQDMSDDEIIGVKSTSIKFKKNLKYFISGAYIISILILFYTFYNSIGFNLFSLFLIFFTLILSRQILKFNKNNPNLCLTLFKNNNLAGAIMFFAFIFQSTNL